MTEINPEYVPPNTPTATFWIQATPTTSYYRCLIPSKAMGAQSILLNDKDLVYQTNGRFSLRRQSGPAIWQFPGNEQRKMLMGTLQSDGVPVFAETDDCYLVAAPSTPGYESAWKMRQNPGEPEVTNRFTHRRICEAADGMIVSTNHLANMYEGFAGGNIHVCPNSIDPDDWDEPRKIDDDIIRIGYAFSTSHYYDFELILDGLEWASKQPNVEVVLFGEPMKFAAFNRFRWTKMPWVNHHGDYRRMLGVFDIGLAPIISTTWADSKSDLKALEYSMAGVMTVASPVESYKPWFDQACVFPERNTKKHWTRTIKELVTDCDKSAIREFAAEAKRHVLDHRTIGKNVSKWTEAIQSV